MSFYMYHLVYLFGFIYQELLTDLSYLLEQRCRVQVDVVLAGSDLRAHELRRAEYPLGLLRQVHSAHGRHVVDVVIPPVTNTPLSTTELYISFLVKACGDQEYCNTRLNSIFISWQPYKS